MEYGSNHLKPSDMWKDIKPRIGEMLVAINDIETRYGKAVDEAYQSGYEDGKGDSSDEDAYQRGLADAWEAARKIADITDNERHEVFNTFFVFRAFNNYTASEAIEKLNAYEQRQEEIKVGDEVRFKNTGNKFVVTRIFASVEGHKCDKCEGLFDDGEVYESVLDVVEKTGRHFPEIAEVLRKMKEERDEQNSMGAGPD